MPVIDRSETTLAAEITRSAGHTIVVCTKCRATGSDCPAGATLIDRLSEAVSAARRSAAVSEEFAIEGVVCMAGCDRPCTVAYRADGKASYLFGDIETDADIDALVAFADQYAGSLDGWTSATERPAALREKTLARIPSMVAVSRAAGRLDS